MLSATKILGARETLKTVAAVTLPVELRKLWGNVVSLVWTIILVLFGLISGWDFHPLFWWLIVPMVTQDLYDVAKK